MTVTEHTSETIEPTAAESEPEVRAGEQDDLVEEEVLVEEISIDGMCGVY